MKQSVMPSHAIFPNASVPADFTSKTFKISVMDKLVSFQGAEGAKRLQADRALIRVERLGHITPKRVGSVDFKGRSVACVNLDPKIQSEKI